jgi:hypothetical protein
MHPAIDWMLVMIVFLLYETKANIFKSEFRILNRLALLLRTRDGRFE